MKTSALAITVLFAMLATVGCRRTDYRYVTIEIPSLCETNQALVVEALNKYEGIEKSSYAWDFEKKTLTLRYDSIKIAHTNMRMAIEDKGLKVVYPVNTTGRAGY